MYPPASTERIRVFAPAKINLCLHVGDRRPDGYHDLASLVVFADVGDQLLFERGSALSLALNGPFADGLPLGEDNLAIRAAHLLAAKCGSTSGARISLSKYLPAASGVGGGSADAGATLRGLARLWAPKLGQDSLLDIAARLGSDVPMCFFSRPALAKGRGEQLSFLPELPGFSLLLVNPLMAVSTAEVFSRLRSRQGALLEPPPRFHDLVDLVEFLRDTSNDLQAPAMEVAPPIRAVLETLEAFPPIKLARLSGSGATCFGITEDISASEDIAREILRLHPDWWVVPASLASADAATARPG